MEYERLLGGKQNLGEFLGSAKKIQSDVVKKWRDEVLEERAQFWNSKEKLAS
jgi:hypothetical protein